MFPITSESRNEISIDMENKFPIIGTTVSG